MEKYIKFVPIQLFEKENQRMKKEKEAQREEEKEGMDVIKKLQDNFKRFVSAAGGKILKYKEFWEENKKSSGSFDENGNVYKMWDSDYVVGVLNLPDAALSPEELDDEIKLVDDEREKKGNEEEDKGLELELNTGEETEETKEEDADSNEWVRPKGYKFLLEKDKENDNLGLNIELDGDKKEPKEKKEKEPTLGFDFGDKKEEIKPEKENESPSDLEFSEDGEINEYFVVFDMSGNEREEIFRTANPKVIKSFNDFYENTFKSAIKDQIQNFKVEKEAKEAEAKAKADEELKKQRKSKFEKFMKESFGNEAFERAKQTHPDWLT